MRGRLVATLVLASVLLAGCASKPAAFPSLTGSACLPSWSDAQATPGNVSASEVSLAIDPTNPKHVVAVANGFEVHTSLDGGATWAAERLTAVTLSTSGNVMVPVASLSDPSVAFSPDGKLYVATLAYIPASAVLVLERDTPTGPWVVHTVWQSEPAATSNDKEWLGIDPSTGTMVVAWQREPLLDQTRGLAQATGVRQLDVGVIVVSRSADHGATWSVPATVSGSSLQNNGTQVAFLGGKTYLLWVDYEQPALVMATSDDLGQTWSAPAKVAGIHLIPSWKHFSRIHTLPALAAGDGKLAAIWHDGRNGNGDADVFVALYDGNAWGPAERVPDAPLGSDRIQFYPWGAFDASGTLHVTYYAGAIPGDGDNATTFRYRAIERNANGTWSQPVDLSGPMMVFGNATAGPGDIGDYSAVTALGGQVDAAWSQPGQAGTQVHVGGLRPASC